MHYLRDLTVLILGLGDSGLAMARWCAWCGATVRVADTRADPPQAATLTQDVPGATLHHGFDAHLLEGVNLMLRSPGLMPGAPDVAAMLARADELGIPVRGELSLFATALADLRQERGYAPKVVAITGTNGKTTTTSLTAKLIERAGRRVGLAGNIGPTLLDTLRVALEQEPTPAGQGEAAAEAGAAEGEDDVGAAGDALCATTQGAVQTRGAAVPPDVQDEEKNEEPGEGPDEARDDVPEASAHTQTADETLPEADPKEVDLPEDAEPPTVPLADDADAPLTQLAPPPPAAPTFEVLPEAWVLELSSFQLDGVSNFEPDAAAVLNVTQDHLDWHGTMAAYAAAKARIFGKRGIMVINRDDPIVAGMVPPPEVIKSGVRGRPARLVHRDVVCFGLDAPRRPGDFGLVTEGGMAWLVRAREADPTVKLKTRSQGRRGAASSAQGAVEGAGRPDAFEAEQEEIILQRLMPADALRIRGRHNASNALAALALATAIGCPLAPMLHGLREYRGEPHRVEHVATVGGIDAIDDSKGTNVGATVAALLGLGADLSPGKLVVILGGDGKGQDFAPLAEPVGRFARAVALIGKDARAIQAVLAEVETPLGQRLTMQEHGTLEEATRWAFEQAVPGDAVLLSPACASLDMFRNYAHRAEVFVQTVQDLAADRGEMA